MGYFHEIICIKCNKVKKVFQPDYQSYINICDDCRNKIEKEDRKNYFDRLDNMSIEDRIREIEEILYDNKNLFKKSN